MAQIINTNILSLTTQRNLNKSATSLQTSMERLSSGLRINSAKDDAAGLAISERFTTQIRGLNQAVRNANDGVSFAQTAEGALSTVGDSLQRIRELAVQSINDTNSASDRQALNNEVSQLIAEVNRVASATQFNGQNILDGSLSNLTFQVGANQNQTITVTGVDSRGSQLGARTAESASIAETALAADTDLVVNGVTIATAAETTVDAIISKINESYADTGVQALKATTVNSGNAVAYAAPAADSTVTINSVSVTIAAGTVVADAVTAINAVSNQTGVTATNVGGAIELSNTSGTDIVVTDAGNLVGGTETYHAGIVFAGSVADGAYTLAGGITDVAGVLPSALTQTDNTLNQVDVLTGANSTAALLTMDFALQQVTGLRAELGSVQTRFESTISNLEVTAENMTAARSRIRDADFAKETAELTRVQILQQAGISMLAQANAQPQNVLALLQ